MHKINALHFTRSQGQMDAEHRACTCEQAAVKMPEKRGGLKC